MYDLSFPEGRGAFPGVPAPVRQRMVAAAVALAIVVLVLGGSARPAWQREAALGEAAFLASSGNLAMPGLLSIPLWTLPAAERTALSAGNARRSGASGASYKALQDYAQMAERIPTERVDMAARDRNLLQSDLDQRNVAMFLANKYDVSEASMRDYVAHARDAARLLHIDPLLILAVMAVESNYDPASRNPSGAQGLMQVLPAVHGPELAPFGGAQALHVPRINIYVGGLVLKQCIALAGSLEQGLRYYVGASDPDIDDQGYVRKVAGEWSALRQLLGSAQPATRQVITGASP